MADLQRALQALLEAWRRPTCGPPHDAIAWAALDPKYGPKLYLYISGLEEAVREVLLTAKEQGYTLVIEGRPVTRYREIKEVMREEAVPLMVDGWELISTHVVRVPTFLGERDVILYVLGRQA